MANLKNAVLRRDSKKISREATFECPEAYVYSTVSMTGIPDDVKEKIDEKHKQFWEEALQIIEAHTSLTQVQAPELTGDPIHKCQ